MKRPRSIAEIADRAAAGVRAFDPAVREFIDAWQLMSLEERRAAVAAEPVRLGGVKDAYLGALAGLWMMRSLVSWACAPRKNFAGASTPAAPSVVKMEFSRSIVSAVTAKSVM